MFNEFEIQGANDLLGNVDEVHDGQTLVEETAEIPTRDLIEETVETDINEQSTTTEDNPESDDFIGSLLKEYGIENRKITYELEDGETKEEDWDSLSVEERVNIIKELTTPQITEDEIQAINYLRSQNISFQDALQYAYQKGLNEYAAQNEVKDYAVDQYSDDELYLAELKNKYGDMSEEEMKQDLEAAKENTDLFNKKVEIIRKQYKAIEDEKAKEQVRLQEEQYNNFVESVKTSLENFNEIPMDYKDTSEDRLGIEIEESQKAEVWEYLLKRNEEGVTQFYKDISEPTNLVKAAWYLKFGDDLMSDITRYWKSELKKSRREEKPKPQATVTHKKDDKKVDTFPRHFNEFIGDESLL